MSTIMQSNSTPVFKTSPISIVPTEKNYETVVCMICENGDSNVGNEIVLCDSCDRGFHLNCINLTVLPPGDWFCGKCVKMANEKKVNTGKKETGNVIVYERVSSKGQDKPEFGRTGLDTQNRVLLSYISEKNYKIKATHVDVGSGQDIEKLKNNKFIETMKAGDKLLVYSVSRLGRNVQQVLSHFVNPLVEKGVVIYSVSENVSSTDPKFVELLKQAEQEGIAQGQKTRDAIANRRKEGHYIGNPGYGWKIEKVVKSEMMEGNLVQKEIRTRVQNDDELEVIKYILATNLKATAMAQDLNDKGYKKRGKDWTKGSVLGIRLMWKGYDF